MNEADVTREIVKIADAISWARLKEERASEMYAAQHCSEKVLYSPLCLKLLAAEESLSKISSEVLSKYGS